MSIERKDQKRHLRSVFVDKLPNQAIQNGELNTQDVLDSIVTRDQRHSSKFLDKEQKFNFQKCVRLYTLMALRLRYNPVFLNRNLSYMESNKRKNIKDKKRLKLNDILHRKKSRSDQKDFSIKIDSIQLEMASDNKKSSSIYLNVYGLFIETNNFEQLISNTQSTINSIPICRIKLTGNHGNYQINSLHKIEASFPIKTIFFFIENNQQKFYLSFSLKNFIESSSNSSNFKTNLINHSTHKPFYISQSVKDMLNNFKNLNFINFTLEKKAKITRQKSIQKITELNVAEKIPNNNSKSNGLTYRFKQNDLKYLETYSNNYKCPFCFLNQTSLTFLIDHMKNSHPRFIFQESSDLSKERIDVYLDECFDGSYSRCLNSFKLNEFNGYSKSCLGPVKHIPGTIFFMYNNWYAKKLRKNNDLDLLNMYHAHFFDDSTESSNRVYYHSLTNIPKHVDSDEDSDVDPEWLKEQSIIMLNEFQDVNEGEKGLMYLWNVHCTKFNLIANSNVYAMCELFLKENLNELVKKDLVKNCILHFVNLVDYNLIKSKDLVKLFDLISC
ncbi:unnamed protein product [Brachionus calyciflorus]|uniref:Uncharacterized protein n=1 Tax=Brachionus calyciflorus TaxID=104777 RepID=A0A814EED4_9BILA|nr:unnamed protein product [Brachionus calyciflorus]